MIIWKPPSLDSLLYNTELIAGYGTSTVIADFDFETYSEAGHQWNINTSKWECPPHAKIKGLPLVGAAVYAHHHSTDILCLAYDLKEGHGKRVWMPGDPNPIDLFQHLERGRLLEAWNVAFEYWIWTCVGVKRYGWPALPIHQLRCAMAKSRAYALPGSLENAGTALNINNKKDTEGKRLITKFCLPHNPTVKDSRRRILCDNKDEDTQKLYKYCVKDITAESELSSLIPDLSPSELEFWQYDQIINRRGVQIDEHSLLNCIDILRQGYEKYNQEILNLTHGEVKAASEVPKLKKWLRQYGLYVDTLDAEMVKQLIETTVDQPQVNRVLKIREMVGSAAVKKLYAMQHQLVSGRLHDLFIYHSARTGRAAGAGVQPQNLPNHGLAISWCVICNKRYHAVPEEMFCYLGCGSRVPSLKEEWGINAVENALEVINTRSLECVEFYFKDAFETISGCLRGLFIAKETHELICSDYNAIEAVVLAALAGEQWRLDIFKTHGKIYEISASKITGVPFEEFEKHFKETKQHHPLRKKVGKIAELASGYAGWIGAWKQFGADEFFNNEQIKQNIVAWRKASPAIVEMWGGQGKPWEPCLYGLEGAVIKALSMPDQEFTSNGLIYTYSKHNDALYCRLLSGRYLTYHRPRLRPHVELNRYGMEISFEGWNTNPANGTIGWTRIKTYGGRLTENVVQATARDILAHAIVNLERAGYPVVLHIHDEIVVEMPIGKGSLEELERIMSTMPAWAKDWPIRASGGWVGKRYRKD